MTAAILSIGTEVTRGEIVNTNANWLADKVTAIGYEVTHHEAVDDDRPRIVEALRRLGAQHDVLLCTGGLGPTTDDLTTESAAMAAQVPLVRDDTSVEVLRDRFRRFGRVMVPGNLKQADFPAGACVLSNAVGTAPGFCVRIGRALAFFFPGVPMEMHRIFADHVEPYLRAHAPQRIYQVRYKTFGIPESTLGHMLSGIEERFSGVTIGYRVSFPEIEIKVLARGLSLDKAKAQVELAGEEVRSRIGAIIYGQGSDTFVGAVASAIRTAGLTLGVAESCTGGLIAHLLTSEPASDYLFATMVTYSNEMKTALLGVPKALLDEHGAVSEPVAIAMARGIQKVAGTDIGVGITGVAGPTGGTEAKPVGLVHWAVARGDQVIARHHVFVGDRMRIQRISAYSALALVREMASGAKP